MASMFGASAKTENSKKSDKKNTMLASSNRMEMRPRDNTAPAVKSIKMIEPAINPMLRSRRGLLGVAR